MAVAVGKIGKNKKSASVERKMRKYLLHQKNKKMEKNSILFLMGLIMFTSCHGLNKNKIEKITIKAVDFSVMTFTSVDCDKFEDYFNQQYKLVTIMDSTMINEFLGIISTLESIDSTYSKYVDTRVKVELYSQNDTSLICLGNLSLKKGGEIYKTPQSLIDFIENLYVSMGAGDKK